jgi:hypothetical protein
MRTSSNASAIVFTSGRLAFLAVMGILVLGGISDWIYLNTQELPISLAACFVEYLTSYVSAFLIAGIEIAASYYFYTRYDLGKQKRLLKFALYAGIVGFVAYVVGEVISGLTTLGSPNISMLTAISIEISPNDLDYGNALIIFLSLFGLVLLVGTLVKINPLPSSKTILPKGAGLVGGVWTSAITTVAAMVCCGPLPGVIALATGISSLYFTDLITVQSLLVLVSVPVLLLSIVLADRRARRGCKLR